MKSITQTIVSLAASYLAYQVESKSIQNSCLTMSDQVVGVEEGTFITNEDQLTSESFSDEMRLHSITTCHSKGKVTGLQFQMALDPYESEEVEVYDITPMTPLGLMSGDCEYLELPQGLDKIKATMNG